MNARFLGILFALVLFAMSATAYAPHCSQLSISAGTVRLHAGQSEIGIAFIHNDSMERFYIDHVNVYDFSRNFKAEAYNWDSVVLPNSDALISVMVDADKDAKPAREKAHIELRGHFIGGTECRLGSLGTAKFDVVIETEKAEFQGLPACSGFRVVAPESRTIAGIGSFDITIENNSGVRTAVKLYGSALRVDPGMISVPANTTVRETITVESGARETYLFYKTETNYCQELVKTRIISTVEPVPDAGAGEQPSITTPVDIGSMVGTAFFTMQANAVYIGLILAIVILLLYILVKK